MDLETDAAVIYRRSFLFAGTCELVWEKSQRVVMVTEMIGLWGASLCEDWHEIMHWLARQETCYKESKDNESVVHMGSFISDPASHTLCISMQVIIMKALFWHRVDTGPFADHILLGLR